MTAAISTTKASQAGQAPLDPQARIERIREGIPASTVSTLAKDMGISKDVLLSFLGLPRATISRKELSGVVLSKDESERVMGVQHLIALTRAMVEESGDPTGFDAARWLGQWLMRPLPALGGETAASYMDTFTGQQLVADLLATSQSGAYA